ncbi:MAG: cobalamin biosynthesis protein CbiX [Variovorax paradoxus]|uniref:Cobalamin biosynthesis protein CbiX n=1 Tax=Variovorax paradoxus TaxID=34073 RepID=A0A2W5RH55_VARPD|nr:MAG: cobalamin biosynthesis protein CbiX [Variovorax paradoxus]
MKQGIVLFAHGSRDPRWREPIEAVARAVEARAPGTAVRCAYLELAEPEFPTAVCDLVGAGVQSVRVVPMFLGMGKHAREDLPKLVAAARLDHPGLHIEVAGAVGEAPEVITLLAELALRPTALADNP